MITDGRTHTNQDYLIGSFNLVQLDIDNRGFFAPLETNSKVTPTTTILLLDCIKYTNAKGSEIPLQDTTCQSRSLEFFPVIILNGPL